MINWRSPLFNPNEYTTENIKTSDIIIFKKNLTIPSSIMKENINAGKIQTINIPTHRETEFIINFATGKFVISFNI